MKYQVMMDETDIEIIKQMIAPQVDAANKMLNLSANLDKAEPVEPPETKDKK